MREVQETLRQNVIFFPLGCATRETPDAVVGATLADEIDLAA